MKLNKRKNIVVIDDDHREGIPVGKDVFDHIPTNMKFKISIIVHFIGMALAIVRLCFIPFDDHLRYGIGHMVCWAIVVSAIFAFFYVPIAIPLRKWMKTYFGIYFFNTCFIALYPFAISVLFAIAVCVPEGWRLMIVEDYFVQALIPKTIECENSAYIIRSRDEAGCMDNCNRFYLYKKELFVERMILKQYAGDSEYEEYRAKRILEEDIDKKTLKIEVEVGSFAAHDSIRTDIQEWRIDKDNTE